MLKRFILLPLMLSSVLASINLTEAKPANASGGCVGNCNTDSLHYICLKNTTQKSVYVGGGNDSTNFVVNAAPGGRYWYWFRRPRNNNRNLTVFLNGQRHNAHYKWTGQTPSQLGGDQACFFNKWEIKENSNGLYLRNAS